MKGEIAVTVYYRRNITALSVNTIHPSDIKEEDDSQSCIVDI